MEPIAHGTRRSTEICCWSGCFTEATHLPLCEQHLREAGYAWVRDNIDLVRAVCGTVTDDELLFERVRQTIDQRHPEREAQHEAARRDREAGALVYYLRIGDRIKIGFTTNLRQRLMDLRLDPPAVLATEPGGRDVEARRHHEFAAERYGRREDFAASDRLLAHIATLGERIGA